MAAFKEKITSGAAGKTVLKPGPGLESESGKAIKKADLHHGKFLCSK